ncbi:DUF2298 domain-containing protein [Halococcoides cellulosivorans]|uniref:Chlor_Arch_YYY domain-containing protein n=1 Tax=Halococcoides cellulosivorans TaxID=1679096 RepID=A0A2R4WZR1_9EURY|nr:DUF2298 domain-containing protein [Halococcoides cellulosivorans]AWB27021.1 hypothetical protein HARCEL1_04505 [Halococcoides cellulosivorans]
MPDESTDMEWLAVVVWLGFVLAVGGLALPATARLFAPLSTRGAGFAVTVGTAVVTLVAFWVGHVALWPVAGLAGLLVLFALSAVAVDRGVTVPGRRYAEVSAVFVAVFALGVGLRAVDPGLQVWAEGFLNFGLIESLLRAGTLPPEDMWFAGEPVQYYYGGHLAVALWTRLTGVPVRIGANLAVPTVYAMLAAGAYDLAGAIAATRSGRRRLAGGLAAAIVALGGNALTAASVVYAVAPGALRDVIVAVTGTPAETLAGGVTTFDATHFAGFPTDVPIYLVRIGSLHAHVISQPYTLLAVAIAFTAVVADGRRARLWRLACVAPVAGLVEVTNAWSFPAVVGITALAVAFAREHPLDWLVDSGSVLAARKWWPLRDLQRLGAGVVVAAAVAVGGILVAAPFVFTTSATRPLALLPERTSAAVYLVEYGPFIAAFLLGAWPAIRRRLDLRVLGAALVAALVLAMLVPQGAALFFVAPVLVGSWYLLRRTEVGFEGVLVLGGAGLLGIVELAYLDGGAASGRYNTVYKVHSQVWLLWTVAAGVFLARAIERPGIDPPTVERLSVPDALDADLGRAVAAVVLVGVILSFGVVTTGAALDDGLDDASLDATRFVETDRGDVDAATTFLDARPGQPHIVAAVPREAEMFSFRASPASSLTGLPTVAGWTHAADYHGDDAFDRRSRHVRTIFEGPVDRRAELLATYDVRFVYLGPYERQRYDVRPFEESVVATHSFGSITIYEIDHGDGAVESGATR